MLKFTLRNIQNAIKYKYLINSFSAFFGKIIPIKLGDLGEGTK